MPTITHTSSILSGNVSRGIPSGPLQDQLYLFADYENWQSGDPLPNLAPNGSNSLADNNSAGEETGSPIIGSKSGLYDSSKQEYHGGTVKLDPTGKDIYFSAWIKPLDLSTFRPIVSILDVGSKSGVSLDVKNTGEFRMNAYKQSSGFRSAVGPTLSTNTDYFVEGWYTDNNEKLHARVDDGTENTFTLSGNISLSELAVEIGFENSDYFDGVIDNVIIELAPVGELILFKEGTWQHNGGAGRTASEYESKFNIIL